MRAIFRLGVLACASIAAGCGGSTRIVPLDADRYQMTVYAHPAIVGSTAQLLERAWQEGAEVCARQGRKLQPDFESKQNPDHADRSAYAQMNFKCVEPQAAR